MGKVHVILERLANLKDGELLAGFVDSTLRPPVAAGFAFFAGLRLGASSRPHKSRIFFLSTRALNSPSIHPCYFNRSCNQPTVLARATRT
jgi:hypothetical protein